MINVLNHNNSSFSHPSAKELYRYWETVRGAKSAPSRDRIDLASIAYALPQLFIIENDAGSETFKWRLAGTGIGGIYGQDVTGKDVLSGWGAFESNVMRELFDSAVKGLQTFVVRCRATTTLQQTIEAEMIGLPVQSRDGSVLQIFGGIFPFQDLSQLSHKSIAHFELLGARSIWTEPLPDDPLFTQSTKPSVARSALRLIIGGLSR